tara:strand:- start:2975 stop:3355 length:381 start_codon:yes stop_codon:yes gene_type:complete
MATFTDFNTSLAVHPVNGDLSLKNDADAVKQSIKSLVLTDKLERPFQPTVGCDIRRSLFENFSPQTIMMAKQRIAETVGQYEPRAELINIEASPDEDNNTLNIAIIFSLVNSDVEEQLSLVLERVR